MADSRVTDIESITDRGPEVSPVRQILPGRASIKSVDEYEALYRRAEEDPEGFWAECANAICHGSSRSIKSSNGIFRLPNGFSAARSTPPTIASTVI